MNAEQKLALLDSLKPSAKARKALVPALDKLTPCVWLVPTKKKSESVGCVGGGPLLAKAQSWPDQGGQPLPFLLRLNLSALPEWLGLPRQGILQAFGGVPEFRLSLLVEGQAAATESSAPGDAYFGHEPQAGELYERILLRAMHGLCWCGSTTDEVEDEPLMEFASELQPDEVFARLGGPPASWIDAAQEQESAYLKAHGHSAIEFGSRPKPESLEADIQRLAAQPRLAPFNPGPVPPEVQTELSERATRAAAIAALLKSRKLLSPEVSAAAQSMGRLARAAKRGADVSGAAAQNWIDLAFDLGAWETLLTEMPANRRKVLAEVPVFGFSDLCAKVLALEARQRRLLEALGKPKSKPGQEARFPGDGLREKLEHLGELDRDRDTPPKARREAWAAVRELLVESVHPLTSGEIAWALREIYRTGHNIIVAENRNAGSSLELLRARQKALRWWHKNPEAHGKAMKRWAPVLIVFSAGEFLWNDCGHLIFWADPKAVRAGNFKRAVGQVAST